jgi:hypothetical protein
MSEHMAQPTMESFHLENTQAEYKPDSIVQTILTKFIDRSKFGKQKYGTDLDRQDLSVLDWINHAQEEHMDAILYLEKLKQTIQQEK